MAYNTAIIQGKFQSIGVRTFIPLRSDVDWMQVYNLTTTAAGGAGTGVQFYWQRGLAAGAAIEYQKLAADESMSPIYIATGGFTLLDTSANPRGPLNATITAISNAAIPIVSATSTAGLVAGDVVRMVNIVGGQQLGGIDFTIDTVVANTSFRLPYMAQIVAATTGSFYPIKWEPIFYPRHRYISSITQAANAVVELTVTHGFTVGQKVRLQVPAIYDMTQMDGRIATVTAVNLVTNTITIDVDSTAFTAFAFPLTTDTAFTPAQVVPVGMAAESPYENLLDDAIRNVSDIGMQLDAGVDSPAGVNGDIILWRAGKSFDVLNTI